MKSIALFPSLLAAAALVACGQSQFAGSQAKPVRPATAEPKKIAAVGDPVGAVSDADGGAAGTGGAEVAVVPTPSPSAPSPSAVPAFEATVEAKVEATPLPTPKAVVKVTASPTPAATLAAPSPVPVRPCSAFLEVPAKSNPWLAGAPDGTTLTYTNGVVDSAPGQSPLHHASDCVEPGKKLAFEARSDADHSGGNVDHQGEGKVDRIAGFDLGPKRGLSNVKAPFDSLVGVFLPAAYGGDGTPPETLDFSSAAARDFHELRPKLGQVFFIGDGRRSDGNIQRFVVPAGASRVVFGNMDSYEWNNNVGSHKVRVNEVL